MPSSTALAPADRLFWEIAARYPTRPMVCALYLELAAAPDRARLERRLHDLAVAHPRLAAALVVDHGAPRWRPAHAPALACSTDDAADHPARLARLTPALGAPLPEGGPAWAIEVLAGPTARVHGVLLRWHHALSDAEGMLDLLTELTDPEDSPPAPEGPDERKPTIADARPPGPLARLRRILQRLRGAPRAGGDVGGARIDYRDLDVPLAPHHLSALATALGVLPHDLFVGTVAHALHNLGLDGPTTTVHAPLSARPRGAPVLLGNHGHPLHVVVDGPRERPGDLAAALRALGAANAAAVATAAPPPLALLRLLPHLPRRAFERTLARAPRFIANYLPWSGAPRRLAGAPILALHGFAPLLPFRGCTVAAIPYAGHLRLTLATDPAIHPDPAPIDGALVDAFAALAALAGVAGV